MWGWIFCRCMIQWDIPLPYLEIEMSDKDKEAKERLRAWRALPVEGRISWEGFKRQWAMMSDEQRKAAK